MQKELGKFTQASENHTTSPSTQKAASTAAKKSSDLSSLLRTTHQACDHAISQLLDFIIASSIGGEDIAAEILEELWQAGGLLAKQQQASLETELTATKEQLHAAKKKASEAVEQLNEKLEAEEAAAKEQAAAGKKKMGTTRKSRGGGSGGNGDSDSADDSDEDSLESSEKSKHLLSLSKASVAALETLNSELKVENARLIEELKCSQEEVKALSDRTATLEITASEVEDAKTLAETAERELEELKRKHGQLTPRPPQEHHELRALLGEESKIEIALAALDEHSSTMSCEEVAMLLVTEPPPLPSLVVETAKPSAAEPSAAEPSAAEPSSAEPSSAAETSSANEPSSAVEPSAAEPSSASAGAPVEAAALDAPVEVADKVATDLPTSSSSTPVISLEAPLGVEEPTPAAVNRFSGLLTGVAPKPLSEALSRACGPTNQRYSSLETAAASLRLECIALEKELATYREVERKREAARKRRDEESQLEKKNAIQQYLDLLASQGEETWKEQLIGMGQTPDVPKFFHHSGKVRNRHMSKRDTEKLVKELWKERLVDPAVSAGRAGDLVDFVGKYLQKKVGIAAAVVELGYNFLYGLWVYQWDADCELFLKILTGEIREEVYIAANKLQYDLEELFALMDKAKGQATGSIPKDDLRIALASFFRVGQPGGKDLARFDEIMQALDEDQPGSSVEWKKVFEEDREFNQGEFAETLRDQFLQERIDFFNALEVALYEEANDGDECTKAQIIRAILNTDAACTEKAAGVAASSVFGPGVESLSIVAVMKKLSRGMLRGGESDLRGSLGAGSNPVAGRKSGSGKGSVMVKGKASLSNNSNSPGGGATTGKLCLFSFQIHRITTLHLHTKKYMNEKILPFLFSVQVYYREHESRMKPSARPWRRCGKNGSKDNLMISLLVIVVGIKLHSLTLLDA